MGRLSSTEANKRLERLEHKRRKIEAELLEAKEKAKEAQQLEQTALEVGFEILCIADISDKKQFLNWLSQNINQIPGVKKRQISEEKDEDKKPEAPGVTKKEGQEVI